MSRCKRENFAKMHRVSKAVLNAIMKNQEVNVRNTMETRDARAAVQPLIQYLSRHTQGIDVGIAMLQYHWPRNVSAVTGHQRAPHYPENHRFAEERNRSQRRSTRSRSTRQTSTVSSDESTNDDASTVDGFQLV
uniref:Uncharacterized protein n=1 Tax=Grammatophora oceanica TaxID=210454 RepID=A0A7S1VDH9_9STRA|mmetsp:Transcript_42126/g.62401  ORF Transcript_42126/g.62401 Transcript_42126/m.62401 type:complete len:134 (+) Transcript_42126:172-573(+)